MKLVQLSRQDHGRLRIRGNGAEILAAGQHLIAIVTSEFRRAATEFPILFAKHPETGRFTPFVLTGLAVEENLYWDGTRFDAAYVPLNVRRQPFYVGLEQGADGGSLNVLCIDVEHPAIAEDGDRTILDDDGVDSAYLRQALEILGELIDGRGPTEAFVADLLAHDLIVPMALDIRLDDGGHLYINDLYGLDEERFERLAPAQHQSLWDKGYFPLIYAQFLSIGHIQGLIRRKNALMAMAKAWLQPAAAE